MSRVVSGGWGCGAFGNSLIVMYIIQVRSTLIFNCLIQSSSSPQAAAAAMAGVSLQFHAYTDADYRILTDFDAKFRFAEYLQRSPSAEALIQVSVFMLCVLFLHQCVVVFQFIVANQHDPDFMTQAQRNSRGPLQTTNFIIFLSDLFFHQH